MKRTIKQINGVTLLEVMLVLAIAAMVIVMSVRYYQTAMSSEQENVVLEQIQNITASVANLTETSGSYAVGVSNATVSPLLPALGGLTLPWGTTITVTGTSATTFTAVLTSVPMGQCPLIIAKLTADSHYSATACTAGGVTPTLTITYTSTN